MACTRCLRSSTHALIFQVGGNVVSQDLSPEMAGPISDIESVSCGNAQRQEPDDMLSADLDAIGGECVVHRLDDNIFEGIRFRALADLSLAIGSGISRYGAGTSRRKARRVVPIR